MKLQSKLLATFVATLSLSACGGGDSNSSNGGGGSGSCSVAEENQIFFDYMLEDYFWYKDIPANIDPTDYASVYDLLDAMVAPQDRYSFILTEQEYQSRFVNAAFIGFGFSSRRISSQIFINYVYPGSPAANAGLRRADELIAIDGVAVSTLLSSGQYDAALGAAEEGVTVELQWQRPDGTSFTELVSKTEVETDTVLAVERYALNGRDVGYFVLNSFINRTGDDLNGAYDQLVGVDDLIIDVRYNGGGLIRYANQASTQAAGNNVIGNVFVEFRYNDKNTASNNTSLFQLGEGVQQLDLDRVFVLTTGSSCSSSELIINSLEPFVEVVVIGGTTCGKPVGQSTQPFCDKRSFVVNFETVNANGQGRYFDGIAANCLANDVLVGDWGVSNDPLLAEANFYINNNACSGAATSLSEAQAKVPVQKPSKHPLLEQWRSEH